MDRWIPIHSQGSTKAPVSSHTTRAGEADRDGHPGRVKRKGQQAIAETDETLKK